MAKLIQQFTGGTKEVRDKLNEMVDVCNSVRQVRTDGFINVQQGRSGLLFGLSMNQLLPRIPKPDLTFTAKILSSSADGAGTNRWTYTFEQVRKTDIDYNSGAGGWTAASDGYTGTAYNFAEVINSASGTQGNGVDVANLLGTFALQPCPRHTSGTPCDTYHFWHE